MRKLNFQFRAISILAVSFGVVLACGGGGDGDEDSDGSGDGDGDGDNVISGTGGAGSGTGGAGNPTGGAATTDACDGQTVVGGCDPLIDDFNEETPDSAIPMVDGRVGSWFVSNDGTQGAVQTPAKMAEVPTAGEGEDGSGAFVTTATGFDSWGANFGLSLNDDAGSGCAYDASAFDGIQFDIYSPTDAQTIKVGVPVPAVIPVTRPGGACAAGPDCDNTHHKLVTLSMGWQHVEITWAELAQDPNWGLAVEFSSANIAQITFASNGKNPYDVKLDNVAFLGGGSAGGGGEGGSCN